MKNINSKNYLKISIPVIIILTISLIIIIFSYFSFGATNSEQTFEYNDINGNLDIKYSEYLSKQINITDDVTENDINSLNKNILYDNKGNLIYKVIQNPKKGLITYTGRQYGYGFDPNKYGNDFKNISFNGYARMYWNDVITGIDDSTGELKINWLLVDNAIKQAAKYNVKMNFRAFATYSPFVNQYVDDFGNRTSFVNSCKYDNDGILKCSNSSDKVEKYVIPESVIQYCNNKTKQKYPNPDSNKPEQNSCGELKYYYPWSSKRFYEQWIPNYKNEFFQQLSNQLNDKFAEHLSETNLDSIWNQNDGLIPQLLGDKKLGDFVEFIDIGSYGIYGEQHLGFGYTYMNNTYIKNYINQNKKLPTSEEIEKKENKESSLEDVKQYTLTGGQLLNGYISPFLSSFNKYSNLNHILIYNSYVNNTFNFDTSKYNYDDYKWLLYGSTGRPTDSTDIGVYDKVMNENDRISTRTDGFLVNNTDQKDTIAALKKISLKKPILLEYAVPGHDAESLLNYSYFTKYIDSFATNNSGYNKLLDNQQDYIKNKIKMQAIYNEAYRLQLTYLELIPYKVASTNTNELKNFKYRLRDLETYLANHIGYYYKILSATYSPKIEDGQDLDLKVTIKNDGFTNLYNKAYLYAAILDYKDNVLSIKMADSTNSYNNVQSWKAGNQYDITISNILEKKQLASGKYKLAIGIIDAGNYPNPSYLFGSNVSVTDNKWSILGDLTIGEIKHPSITAYVPTIPVKNMVASLINVTKGLYDLSPDNEYQYYLSTSKTALNNGSWKTYKGTSEIENIGTNITGNRYLFVKPIKDVVGLLSSNVSNITSVGGENYHVFGPYAFDNTEPTCSITSSNKNLTNKDIILTVTGDDETSESSNLSYSLDNGATYGLLRTKAINENGIYNALVKDEAGNVGMCSIKVNNIDHVSPSITFTPNGSDIYSKIVETKVTVLDDHELVDLKYLWVQGTDEPDNNDIVTSFNNNSIITKNNVTGNNWYLWILATDEAGNITKKRSGPFMLDNTGPIVSLTQNGNRLIITARDSLVNLADMPYSWDNVNYSQNNTLIINRNGTYTAYVKDELGNTTSISILIKNITNGAPTISINDVEQISHKNVNISISVNKGSKDLNSMNKYEYYLSDQIEGLAGGKWINYIPNTEFTIGSNTTGVKYLYVKSITDIDGLESSSYGDFVTIGGINYHRFGPYVFDNTKPTCSLKKNIINLTNENITLTIDAKDETSNHLKYSFDNKIYMDIRNNSVSKNGAYEAYVKDEAGNIGKCIIKVTNIDKTSPKIVMNPNGTSNYGKSVSVKLDVTDDYELEKVNYLWVKGNNEPDNIDVKDVLPDDNIITKSEGTGNDYHLWILATDKAGNIAKVKSKSYKLDNTAPDCTITRGEQRLIITAVDNDSNLSDTPFSWDNKNYKESNILHISTNQNYIAYIKDKVGNIGKCEYKVDNLVSVPNTLSNRNKIIYLISILSITIGLFIIVYITIKKNN